MAVGRHVGEFDIDPSPSPDRHQYHTYGLCHDGSNPRGLSITYDPTRGTTNLFCQAHQCSQRDVLAAFGISAGDLFDVRIGEGASEPTSVATTGERLDRVAQFRARLFDRDGLDSIPPPSPLIEGWLYHDTLTWIAGSPKSGKSLVALDMAFCMGAGIDWEGATTKPGLSVYVAAEGLSGMTNRVRALEQKYGQRMDNVPILGAAPQLLDGNDVNALIEVIEGLKPAVVWLDTQARMTVGADEQSAQDMGRAIAASDRIRLEVGCSVVLLHHIVKTGTGKVSMRDIRGSGAMAGSADTMIGVHKDKGVVNVHVIDHKDAKPDQEHTFGFVDAEASVYLSGTLAPPSPVERMVATMDEMMIPDTATPRTARQYSGQLDGTNEVLAAACKIRRARVGSAGVRTEESDE